jgi:hypothetical protein
MLSYGCFCVTMAELHSWDRDWMAFENEKFHHLSLSKHICLPQLSFTSQCKLIELLSIALHRHFVVYSNNCW